MVAVAIALAAAPKRPKACDICGTDITQRGRAAFMCLPCAHEMELLNEREARLKRETDRQRRIRARKRLMGLEYEHQTHSGDGMAYIITNQGRLTHRIEKVCQDCHKTDEEVRGWWAPIFSSFDSQGNELEPVLLCLVCYRLECQGYSEIEKGKKYA